MKAESAISATDSSTRSIHSEDFFDKDSESNHYESNQEINADQKVPSILMASNLELLD